MFALALELEQDAARARADAQALTTLQAWVRDTGLHDGTLVFGGERA